VWRLEQGRAVLIAYQIYRGPNSQYGKIPGVLGRSEFGLEIVVEIAYLVYVIGLSFGIYVCSSRKQMPCCSGWRGIGKTSSRSYAPSWPTRWWCMRTKRVGA